MEGKEEGREMKRVMKETTRGCNAEQDRQAGLGRAASLESANSSAGVCYVGC